MPDSRAHNSQLGAAHPAISASGDDALLTVDGLHVLFPTARGMIRAVDGVSLRVRTGESLGIVGESGSGKSVLVRTVMNLLPRTAVVPRDARIIFDGRDVRHLPPEVADHFWGPEISMIFQDPMTSLNPVRRIGQQIGDPLRYHLGLSRRAATATALDLLGQVGISDPKRRLDQYPHELSGGMRQRVMIAIALSCEPKMLIADEPTTALDVTVQRQVLELLRTIQRDREMAMILISHDLGVVAGHTDRVAVMYAGRVVESADTSTLFTDVRHRYTQALLRCTPNVRLAPHTRLAAISGRPPDLTARQPGCPFAPRCAYATDGCRVHMPPLVPASASHLYACHHPATADDQPDQECRSDGLPPETVA